MTSNAAPDPSEAERIASESHFSLQEPLPKAEGGR
jgi:hypothetical protein